MEATQNLLREWRSRGIRVRPLGHTHTFREHNKEADLRADKGAKVRVEEWVDTARIAWSDVTGLCGFWDGSCDYGNCGCGIVIMAHSDLHDWSAFNKKCWPVPGVTSVDAELGGCGMLVENLCRWVDKCARQKGA